MANMMLYDIKKFLFFYKIETFFKKFDTIIFIKNKGDISEDIFVFVK